MALTTDATSRWSAGWLGWENYPKLMSQMVRWSMRPTGDQGKFTVATEVQEGQVRVVITALDKNDEFLNYLSMIGSVSDPNMGEIPLKIEQTAPGRYVGAFPAGRAGSYLILVKPGADPGADSTRESTCPSPTSSAQEPNVPLLEQIARMRRRRGAKAKLSRVRKGSTARTSSWRSIRSATICRRLHSSQDIWYYLLVLASCLFFGDVFLRRVQVSFAWLPRAVGRLLGRKPRRPRRRRSSVCGAARPR